MLHMQTQFFYTVLHMCRLVTWRRRIEKKLAKNSKPGQPTPAGCAPSGVGGLQLQDANHASREKEVFALNQNVAYSPTLSGHEYEAIPI